MRTIVFFLVLCLANFGHADGQQDSTTEQIEGNQEPFRVFYERKLSFEGEYSHVYYNWAKNTTMDAELAKLPEPLQIKIRSALRILLFCDYVVVDSRFEPYGNVAISGPFNTGVITKEEFNKSWGQLSSVFTAGVILQYRWIDSKTDEYLAPYLVDPLYFLKSNGYIFNENLGEWIPKKGALPNCKVIPTS